jgi:hypothetical protein
VRCRLVTALLVGHSLLAQAEPRKAGLAETLSGPAKEAYESARARFRDGDYTHALELLRSAMEASPDPRLFWNMAACEEKLHHYAVAMSLVDKYLAAGGPLLGPTEKKNARQFLEAVVVFVGNVVLSGAPDGTKVFVDDSLIGTAPFAKPIRLDQGQHRVRFVRTGYRDLERAEAVIGGADQHWAIALEPQPSPQAVQASAPRPLPQPGPPRSRLGPLLVGGAGLVVAATGAALVGVSFQKFSDVQSQCSPICAPSQYGPYQSMQVSGYVLLGVGVAALGAGIVWLALRGRPSVARAETALVHF